MKKIISTLLISFVLIQSANSQNNNLVVYSQDGYKFSLILNGVLQNEKPGTNVKITGLNAQNYQAKVIFENKMPDLNGNVYLMWGGNQTSNTEYSYSIAEVRGKMKLKMNSTEPTPIQVNVASEPQQTTVVYEKVAPEVNVENTTTTLETNTMGMPGVNIGITINTPDGNVQTGTVGMNATNTHITTTTTKSTVGIKNNNNKNNNVNNNQNGFVLQGYSGVYGCPYPMGDSDFQSSKQSISSKGFDESRLTIAKQIIGSNCMLCSQIKEIMKLMSFEATKLDLAKFAWHHNLDKGNYYKLNDAFDFESSITDLNEYTQSH